MRELASGSTAPALTNQEASDALAALEQLQAFRELTGQRVSLVLAVSEYTRAAGKLNGYTMTEAVEGFMSSVVTVKRVELKQVMEEFIELRKAKTIAKDGKRPRLSVEYHYLASLWLREFASTFPALNVCDLTKDHVASYMALHIGASPKTRNARRGVVKMFLRWAVEKDYLATNHRLFESGDIKHEPADPEDIDFYRAEELAALLAGASEELRPFLALAGLAGLREKEVMRLSWEDIFRIPGHIEIAAFKAKTRSRRLVQICPALAEWIKGHELESGPIWKKSYDTFHIDFGKLRERLKIPNRRNGLRHSFVSAHFALYSNEGQTAAQAGNSPTMVHKNYKGLMTKADGEAWFNITPKVAK